DPSVLFTTAGMQPLVPYLLGALHPEGKRIVNVQKCVRTQDIDEVGDNIHDTFFEMLGNWSLGDYFKEDAIKWSCELLTDEKEGFGLDTNRLYITVFEGDEDAPRDEESAEIWKSIGISPSRIYFLPKQSNWWSPGDNGPCGPDTEMFYDITPAGLGDLSLGEFLEADKRQDVIEVWNDVFMEFEKKDGKVIGKLKQKNVDTGAGLERLSMVLQAKNNVFETDLFSGIMEIVGTLSKIDDLKSKRIVADHVRTAVFLIADGVLPGNTDQGYVLRRLLRRAVRYADLLNMEDGSLQKIVDVVIKKYTGIYKNLAERKKHISATIADEEVKFRNTLKNGLKEFQKLSTKNISGKDAFQLFSTYGFPIEMTVELAKEKGVSVDVSNFEEEVNKHRSLSREGAEKKFKGGLADHSEQSLRYHTATHLLHQALREVLGSHVFQKGSNITPERLRFDFSHGGKMTDEEKKKVEDIVNEKITSKLPVSYDDIPLEDARKRGAIGLFGEKYGEIVRIYQIGEGDNKFSVEFCGGPHVENTAVLGKFSIVKEEAVSAGVRRIKAVLR
ncbi:MAG: alanine--tRNA ligase, partial [Patescibacteria group bacterium]